MKTSSIEASNLVSVVSSDRVSKQDVNQINFSNVLNNIAETSGNDKFDITNQKSSDSVSKKATNLALKEKLKTSDDTSAESKKVDESDDRQVDSLKTKNICEEKLDSANQLEETSEKIKNTLLDILNISEEDLELAMQTLGLNYLDCLDKNNLVELLTQVTGNGDVSALITDETLYQQFNDITTVLTSMKENVLADLGITEKELTNMLEQYKATNSAITDGVNQTLVEDIDQAQMDISDEEPTLVDQAKENIATQIVSSDDATGKPEKAAVNSVDNVLNENGKIKPIATQTQSGNEQKMSEQEETVSTQIETFEGDEAIKDNYQNYIPRQEGQGDALNNVDDQVLMNEKPMFDTESLIKQIQSQIKISTNLDTTKMQFQLNPEHLGKLTVQLASKDGVVTAQITAQNTLVKEVLESQIIQLRENMNNQGVKVEAVEVTVESHAFERNLEQDNSNGNQEQYESQQKKTTRQFNLNDIDSLEDLSTEEALVAEMMIGNGNSINYTA
jgi:flagellar hook-length control protein FliK